MHITERFNIDEANGELVRDYILEDPEYFNTPYIGHDRQKASATLYTLYNCTDLA